MKHAKHITVGHHDGYDCGKCHKNFGRGDSMVMVSGVDDRVFLCMPCVAKLCTSRSAAHVIDGKITSRRTATMSK